MKLHGVTISGADDNTDILQMQAVQDEFPFVEWGILIGKVNYSFDNLSSSKPRYPSRQWIGSLIELRDMHRDTSSPLRTSMHLCGDHALSYSRFDDMATYFDRVQLNAKDKLAYLDAAQIAEVHEDCVGLIIQANQPDATALKLLQDLYDHLISAMLLLDASGGRGQLPAERLSVPPGAAMVGHAGGFSPDNILEQLKLVEATGVAHCWIDMETKVRTNDELDFAKVRSVLQQVRAEGYIG